MEENIADFTQEMLARNWPEFGWVVHRNPSGEWTFILLKDGFSGTVDLTDQSFLHPTLRPSQMLEQIAAKMVEMFQQHIRDKTAPKTDPVLDLHGG